MKLLIQSCSSSPDYPMLLFLGISVLLSFLDPQSYALPEWVSSEKLLNSTRRLPLSCDPWPSLFTCLGLTRPLWNSHLLRVACLLCPFLPTLRKSASSSFMIKNIFCVQEPFEEPNVGFWKPEHRQLISLTVMTGRMESISVTMDTPRAPDQQTQPVPEAKTLTS